MDKAALRTHHRALRRSLTAPADWPQRLAAHSGAGPVAVYLSVRGEIDTRAFVAQALAEGRPIAIPRVEGREMRMVRLHDLAALERGVLAIPTTEGPTIAVQTVLVPGVAFTPRGERLGQGGGYYDRWLRAHPEVRAIGLAHDEQIVDALPLDPWDRPVHEVLTPTHHFLR